MPPDFKEPNSATKLVLEHWSKSDSLVAEGREIMHGLAIIQAALLAGKKSMPQFHTSAEYIAFAFSKLLADIDKEVTEKLIRHDNLAIQFSGRLALEALHTVDYFFIAKHVLEQTYGYHFSDGCTQPDHDPRQPIDEGDREE